LCAVLMEVSASPCLRRNFERLQITADKTLLGTARRLFISPDGQLNLIPFAALADEQNRYLVENYSITYLISGRDLLHLQVHTASNQGPIIFADPLYDADSSLKHKTVRPRRVKALNNAGSQTTTTGDGTKIRPLKISLIPNLVACQAQRLKPRRSVLSSPMRRC
jgi:hypothetical protein